MASERTSVRPSAVCTMMLSGSSVPLGNICANRSLPSGAFQTVGSLAQYEVYIKKLSGREVSVGMVTVARAEAEDGLQRAKGVAALIAEMSGSNVEMDPVIEGPAARSGAS